MTNGSAKPRVISHMATGRGQADAVSLQNQLLLATRGACTVMHGVTLATCTPHNFNISLAQALNMHERGVVDYWVLRHDDIEIRTPGYIDVLIAEARRVGAAALSAVVAIKDTTGLTSTAVEVLDPWFPKKLTIEECQALPPTFGSADVGKPLLINTGVLLIDLSYPQWHTTRPHVHADGSETERLEFAFNFNCRIIRRHKGGTSEWAAQFRPEDWDMSRWCHEVGLPVFATRELECLHKGDWAWSNQYPAFNVIDKEAVGV